MNINTADCEIIRETFHKSDFNFKLVIIGDSGVGKSCLAIRAVNEQFESITTSTIGFDFFHFAVKVNQKVLINLKIWDTCGQEKYRSLISSFYDKATLAIIMYSIDSHESFDQVPEWVKQLKTNSSPDCKVVLIGSKNDLEEKRQVPVEEGRQCKEQHQFEFFMETSSKTGFNVEELFKQIAMLLYNEQVQKPTQKIDSDVLDLVKDVKQSSTGATQKKCCLK